MSFGDSFNLEGFLRLNAGDFNESISDAEQETRDFGQQAEETADTVESSLGGRFSDVGRSVRDTGLKMSAAVTAPLGAIGLSSVQAASKAEEAESRFNSVFETTGTEVESFAENFAEEIGRSELAIENMAANFGSILNPMVENEEQSAELSQEFTKLTQDLASFENRDPAKVQRDLTSALSGQSETVRKYGVDLSAARVDQELLNMGIKGGREEATRAQEAQARLNAIINDTQSAQGNAAETSDSFANQQRALRGSIRDLRVEFGEQLLPIAKEVIDIFSGLTERFTALPDRTQKTIAVVGTLAAALGPALAIIGQMSIGIGGLVSAAGTLAGVFGVLTAPILAVVAAAGALAFVFRDEIRVALKATAEFLTGTVAPAARDTAEDAIPVLKDILETTADFLVSTVIPALGEVAGFLTDTVAPAVRDIAEDSIPVLKSILDSATSIFIDLVDALKPVADFLRDVAIRAGNLAADIGRELAPTVGDILSMLRTWAGVFRRDVAPAIGTVTGIVVDLAGKLASVLAPAVDPVVGALDTLVGMLEQNLLFAVGVASDAISGITDLLSGDFDGAIDSAMDIVDSFLSAVQTFASDALDAIVGFVSDVPGILADLASKALPKIAGFVGDAISEFVDFKNNALGTLADLAVDAAQKAADIGADIVSGIADAIASAPGFAAEVITQIADAVPSTAKIIDEVTSVGGDIVDGIISGLDNASDFASDLLGFVKDSIPSTKKVKKALKPLGKAIVDGIVDGITSVPGKIADALGNVFPDLPNVDLGLSGGGQSETPDAGDVAGPGVGGGTGGSGGLVRIGLLPSAASGGYIEESGLAQVHEGEQVVPSAQVTDRGSVNTSETTIEKIVINADSRSDGREAARGLKQELRRQGVR